MVTASLLLYDLVVFVFTEAGWLGAPRSLDILASPPSAQVPVGLGSNPIQVLPWREGKFTSPDTHHTLSLQSLPDLPDLPFPSLQLPALQVGIHIFFHGKHYVPG